MLVYVRPSNEHILIVRVPGAQDQHGCLLPILPSLLVISSGMGADRSPTACVHSYSLFQFTAQRSKGVRSF
jgi:hypothetical protein